MGRQLECAVREVKNIQARWTQSISSVITEPLIGPEATEENFWKLIYHRDSFGGILHVACHGSFESDDPMNSGLLLADSKVDASEIARSSIRFNEVILSAWRAGWRPMKFKDIELSGDDIMGCLELTWKLVLSLCW